MTSISQVKFKKLSPKAVLPTRATPRSAGLDLYSPVSIYVKARRRVLINLDLQIELPKGYFGKIESKSGVALLFGLHIGAGVIDQDYSGNVAVLVHNLSESNHFIFQGDPIAQLIIQQCCYPTPVECEDLDPSTRIYGFGAVGQELQRKITLPTIATADSTTDSCNTTTIYTRPIASVIASGPRVTVPRHPPPLRPRIMPATSTTTAAVARPPIPSLAHLTPRARGIFQLMSLRFPEAAAAAAAVSISATTVTSSGVARS